MTQYLQKIFLLFFFSLITSLSYGQKKMYLSINQYLGGESFSMGQTGTNDLGTKFSISRMDYFISSIILHHDGGASTKVPDKYIFVTKGEKVKELLGSFNIAVLDSITFSIGVDSIDNHADPTLWPANHPLAPRSPDMHWGWAAGYRFVAMEGKTGSALEYDYEIHALGDQLYILCGTILKHGLQHKIAEVFQEIQRSNMSKLDADGKPIYREDGKVMKSELYFKPNIKDILEA